MANFTILEPMSVGDVIDRAVRLYRRNFVPLLCIVAVPGFIGYLATTTFWFGYSKMVLGAGPTGEMTPDAFSIVMLLLGGILYPVWLFTLLFTVAGMSRVIGDHIMLGEPITFRTWYKAARKRLGDIVLMGLLFLVILFVFYFIFTIILFAVIIVAGIMVGMTAGSGFPPWLMATISVIAAILAILAGLAAVLVVISRVVFLPQVVMIEGQSAGQALSRAMQLGKKNWYKVGAIVLFTYFVSLSLLSALTLPVLAVLYIAGYVDAEFLVSPTWNVIYQSFSQLSNLLTLPIWMNAYTLLYFDSRVRKEAYDLELLAREVNPGFYWQPQYQTVMGYQTPVVGNIGRAYVQTSPLGLAGWRPSQAASPPPVGQPVSGTTNPAFVVAQGGPPAPMAQGSTNTEPTLGISTESTKAEAQAAPRIVKDVGSDNLSAVGTEAPQQAGGWQACRECGTALMPDASFCIRCGASQRAGS